MQQFSTMLISPLFIYANGFYLPNFNSDVSISERKYFAYTGKNYYNYYDNIN